MSATSTHEKPTQEVSTQKVTQADILDQLLRPEVQESLTTLVDNLPKLTEMVTVLTKAYDFTQAVVNDPVLRQDLVGGLTEFTKPVTEKAKGIAAAAIEASDRAQADQSTIGVFGLLRMLKDPQMQQAFRFMNAFLNIMSERKQNNN